VKSLGCLSACAGVCGRVGWGVCVCGCWFNKRYSTVLEAQPHSLTLFLLDLVLHVTLHVFGHLKGVVNWLFKFYYIVV